MLTEVQVRELVREELLKLLAERERESFELARRLHDVTLSGCEAQPDDPHRDKADKRWRLMV